MNTDQSLATVLPKQPGKTTKRLHLDGDSALPSVDIMLPCCGEPLDIILDTIRAVCVMDYPQSAFRVLVLDDGNSIELRQAVEELHNTWPNLLYDSRGTKPSQKVYSKAGNLNYAIFEVQGKMSNPPDFIAGFDSDFLPTPNFLRATLPHLLEDQNVGLVGPFQDFYNLPPGDPLAQSLEVYRELVLPNLNERGSSLATGSGYVMRRQLAIDVGGFPTINEVDDMTLSVILTSYGKRVVALYEMLQFGRVPASLEGHVRQRRRWITGGTQMLATPWTAPKDSIPHASRIHLSLIGAMMIWSLLNQSVGCAIIGPALMSGQPLLPGIMPKLQIVLSLITFGFVWLYEWLKSAVTGFRLATFAHMNDLWMCTDRLLTSIRFHLFGSQAGRVLVTGSAQNSWNNPNKIPTRASQLKGDLWDSGVGYNVLFIIAALTGMTYSAMYSIESKSGWQSHAMTTLLCPPAFFMCYITLSCHIIPVLCVIWPPHYPSREAVFETHPSDPRAVFPSERVRQHNVRQKVKPLGIRGHSLLFPVYLTLMATFYFLYL
ncbi:glycosyltransferase family 2 protein [Aspergillus affinis]|uniref:glycosyltransferase family 2 protein n=1 Tax=Aspergillus affinis TaxID=1070780 RepID=UPI0022FEBB2C|nr:nucleotide-diphospho-sugar transferase [Aspergillus affinis]KAI9044911.1 nucleotide-diphospho-sugar transferase [Aspergillus affinis]